jgi:hypothetical protein
VAQGWLQAVHNLEEFVDFNLLLLAIIYFLHVIAAPIIYIQFFPG